MEACELQAFITKSSLQMQQITARIDSKKGQIFKEGFFKYTINSFIYPRDKNQEELKRVLTSTLLEMESLDAFIDELANDKDAKLDIERFREKARHVKNKIETLEKMVSFFQDDRDVFRISPYYPECSSDSNEKSTSEKDLANQCQKIIESLTLVPEMELEPERCQKWLERRTVLPVELNHKKDDVKNFALQVHFSLNNPANKSPTSEVLKIEPPTVPKSNTPDNKIPASKQSDLAFTQKTSPNGVSVPLPISIPSISKGGKTSLNIFKKSKEGETGNEKKPSQPGVKSENSEIAGYKKDLESIFGGSKNESGKDDKKSSGVNDKQGSDIDQEALESLKGPGKGGDLKLSRYFLESEFKGIKEKNSVEYNRIKSIIKSNQQKYSSIVEKNGNNWTASISSILKDINEHFIKYGKNKSSLTKDIYELNGGDLTAQSKVLISALKDSGIELPPDTKIGVQETDKGYNPILFNTKTGEVSSLTDTPTHDTGKIFSPEILINKSLLQKGLSTGISEEKFEIEGNKKLTNLPLESLIKKEISDDGFKNLEMTGNGSGGLYNCPICTESTFPPLSSNYFDQIEKPDEWVQDRMDKNLSHGIAWTLDYEWGARTLPKNVVAKGNNSVILFKEKSDYEKFEALASPDQKIEFLSRLQIRGLATYSKKFEPVTKALNNPLNLVSVNTSQLGKLMPISAAGNPDFMGLQFIGRRMKSSIQEIPLEDKRNQDADDWKEAIKKSVYGDDDFSRDKIEKILSLDPGSRSVLKAQSNFLNQIKKNPNALFKALKVLPDEKSREALINLTIYTIQNRVPSVNEPSFSKYLNPSWSLVDQGKVKLKDELRGQSVKNKEPPKIKWIGIPKNGNKSQEDKKTEEKEIELTLDAIVQLMRISTYGSRWHNLEIVPTYGYNEKPDDTNFRGVSTNGKGFALWTKEVSQYLIDRKIPVGHGIFKIYPLIVKNRVISSPHLYTGPKGDTIPTDLAILMDQTASLACPEFWNLSESSKWCIRNITDQENDSYINNLTKMHPFLKQKK